MLRAIFQWPIWAISRVIMSWRYRATIHGRKEALRKPGPYLVLPNHPAYCDPPNIMVHLWPIFQFRPMLLETIFRNPVLAPFAWIAHAIKVPDVTTNSASERAKAEQAVRSAIDALKAGENVALWPSGRLQRDGVERIGGTRAVADILAEVPNATIVLVRTRGLWGSMYSWAATAKPMDLGGLILRGIGLIAASGCWFLPRRRFTIALEAFTVSERPEPKRELLNPWMEEWYNRGETPESPTFVRYHLLFGRRTYSFPPPPVFEQIDSSRVKPEIMRIVTELVSQKLKRPLLDTERKPETSLLSLGLDSLDSMELQLQIEQRFGFQADNVPTSLGQLWALAAGILPRTPPKPPPPEWFTPPAGSLSIEVVGNTIPEAILDRVMKSPKEIASMDDQSGLLRYEDVMLRVLLLAERIRRLPETRIGLLIPASSAGLISLLAIHLAGKLPVVFNWTTGPSNLEHGARLTGVKHVLTSRQFIDRTHVELPGAEFVFLEDIARTIGRFEKIRTALAVRWCRKRVARQTLAKLDPDPQKPAVILFTSGSEKAPKAVPLTHANILADLRGAAPLLKVDRSYSVLVFLPLFHSFGHTVTGLFTFMAGMKVVYHPDPTDAAALVSKTAMYQISATASTPTFFGYMLDHAKPGDLDSLRFVVLGAEQMPQRMFETLATLAPNAEVLEGYGVTECSPVVAVNPRGAVQPGTIGRPVRGIEVCITDVETHAVMPDGEGHRGMLHVHGPIVFPGYLGLDGPQPFTEINGKKWYITGDLAEVRKDGYIRFHGRLKRFIKAGGEMISLPAMEEPFSRLYPPGENGARVAVEGWETEQGRRIVLFTTEELPLEDANRILQNDGFRGIMRLDAVQQVEAVPTLGSGKVDYKQLREMLEEGKG